MIKKRKRYVMSASLIFTAFSPTNLRGDRYEKNQSYFRWLHVPPLGQLISRGSGVRAREGKSARVRRSPPSVM